MEDKQKFSFDPAEKSPKQQKVELKMLKDSLSRDKKIVDNFLAQAVPDFMLVQLKELRKELSVRGHSLKQKIDKLSFQERTELKNIEWLQNSFAKIRVLKYWQLLKILHKFPKHLQIGIDDHLGTHLTDDVGTQELKKCIVVARYVAERTSLQRFLTDCYVLSKLRELQLEEIQKIRPCESPIAKSLLIEEELGIIPTHFLIEKRLGGNQIVGMFKGTDLANNIPVVIKYFSRNPGREPQNGNVDLTEARKRFEREARAFEKLEKHRQTKEQEMLRLVEDAKQKIEEGTREENYDKMQEGFRLFKQGELLCDRHFVKAYCLATGQLYHFATSETGFFVRQQGEEIAFMVMEYMDGINLEEFISQHKEDKTPIPVATVVSILEGLLLALEYCHEEGIIHRDISPPNILLTKDFKVRLTNLGLAKVEDMTQVTAQGAFVGRPGYAAPEGCAQGVEYKKDFSHLLAATDYRFDIYSVGCVAYEMLLGRPPFVSNEEDPEKKAQDLILQHLQKEPIAPIGFRSEIPDSLNQVVMTMLAKRPDQRFRSAHDALIAIRATMSGSSELLQKILSKIGGVRTSKKIPWTSLAKLAKIGLTLTVVFVLGYFFWNWLKTKNVSPPVVTPKLDKEGQTRADVDKILSGLEKRHASLQRQLRAAKEFQEALHREFPSKDGYPPILSPRLIERLTKLQGSVDQLHAFLQKERKQFGKEPAAKSMERLQDFQKKFSDDEQFAMLQIIWDRMKSNEDIARQIKKTRDEEESVQRVARIIKTYLFTAEEKFALIDEKRAYIKQHFPSGQGYFKIPDRDLESLEQIRAKCKAATSMIDNLYQAMLGDDLAKAKQLIQPYEKISSLEELPELQQLSSIQESVVKVVELCERRMQDREQERKIVRGSMLLKARHEDLQKYLPLAKEGWERLSRIYTSAKAPDELFKNAQEEMQKLQTLRSQLLKLEQENRTEAVTLVDPFLSNKIATVSGELKLYYEKIDDQIKIVQIAGQQEKFQQRVGELLGKTKSHLARTQESYQKWNEQVQILRQEYPKHSFLKSPRLSQNDNDAHKIERELKSLIESVEDKIKQQDLKSAYELLSSSDQKITAAEPMVSKLDNDRRLLLKYLEIERNKLSSSMTKARCERTIDKLDQYIKIMSQQITPLQREMEQISTGFPAAQKYPQISPKSRETITKAQSTLGEYQKIITKAKLLLKDKKINSALQVLKEYEGKSLSSPTLIKEFQEVQENLYQTREAAKKFKENKEKIDIAEKLFAEIKTREEKLQKTMPDIQDKMKKMEEYSSQIPGLDPDPKISEYLKDAKMEVKQLQSLMQEAEKFFKQNQYQEAIELLKPYSKEVNTDITVLSILENCLQQYNELLAKLRDPVQREEILRKRMASLSRKEKLEKLRRPPGEWYEELMRYYRQYQSLQGAIEKSLEGKGDLIYTRIQNNWIKIQEYPQQMAELKELLNKINPQKIPKQGFEYREKLLLEYIRTETISISIKDKEMEQIKQALEKIQRDVRAKWLDEETLRSLLNALSSIVREFEKQYQPVYAELLNLSVQ